MSEAYLVPGNTLLKINPGEWAAQLFSPLETHTLEYLDLELFYWAGFEDHLYEIYATTPAGHPTGNPISTGTISEPKIPSKILTKRYRFKMTPITLHVGVNYAVVIRANPADPIFTIFWQYEAATGNYPRGRRMWSGNDGVTWADYFSDDHIFGEFGTPPLPKPEPPPPIGNFALIDIDYFENPTSISISLPTNVPCHLTCYYTDKKPLKHHTSAIVRGLSVPWDTYFCFVAWKAVEQDEEGDTLYHTFQIPDWAYCQTRWFTFRGEVDITLSPSVGPIFQHHHAGVQPFCNLSFNDYPVSPGVPPCWLPFSYGTGIPTYERDSVNVLDPPYSCKITASGPGYIARLRQTRWSSPWLNQTVKCTFHWFGHGRGRLDFGSKSYTFIKGSGWHTYSLTETIGATPTLKAIQVSSGGAGSVFTQLSFDNITLEIL